MQTLKRLIGIVLIAIIKASLGGGLVGLLFAQSPFGRSETSTLFKDFQKATVVMSTGKTITVPKANIFLKNSKLVYKDMAGKNLQANMETVKSVIINKRTFINSNGHLAEVVSDSLGNQLLRAVYVDVEAMKSEYLNNSNITNISGLTSGGMNGADELGVTRLDPSEGELSYPLVANYYFVLNGKTIPCDERELYHSLNKKQREEFNRITHNDYFRWSNEDNLKELLYALSASK